MDIWIKIQNIKSLAAEIDGRVLNDREKWYINMNQSVFTVDGRLITMNSFARFPDPQKNQSGLCQWYFRVPLQMQPAGRGLPKYVTFLTPFSDFVMNRHSPAKSFAGERVTMYGHVRQTGSHSACDIPFFHMIKEAVYRGIYSGQAFIFRCHGADHIRGKHGHILLPPAVNDTVLLF